MKFHPNSKKASKKRSNDPSNEETSTDGKKPKLDFMSEVGRVHGYVNAIDGASPD